MTVNKTEKMNQLFEKIKAVGFWSRLFSWNIIKDTGMEAFNEYKNLLNEQEKLSILAAKSEPLIKEIAEKKLEVENLKLRLQDKENEVGRLSQGNINLQEKEQSLNTEIASLKGQIHNYQKTLEQKQNQLGQLEEAGKQLNSSIQGLKENIAGKQGELNSLNKQIQEKEGEIGKYISLAKSNSERIVELQKDLETHKAKKNVSDDEINKLKENSARYEESLEQKRNYILELEKDISAKEEIANGLQKSIENNQNEFGRLSETINQNNKKIMELNSNIAAQNQDIKHYQEEIQNFQKNLGKLSQTINDNDKKILEINSVIATQTQDIKHHQEDIKEKSKEIATLSESKHQLQKRINEMDIVSATVKQEIEQLYNENQALKRTNATWEENNNKRVAEHQQKAEKLQTLIEQLEKDKEKIKLDKENEMKEKFEKMRHAWKNHEENVKKSMLEICRRHDIDYLEDKQLPFKGKPDNTIHIAGEYIIFDAKCPMTEDLENFPKYVQNQAELLKKYAKEDKVKKDMFLIVPSNTIATDDFDKKALKTFYHNMTDYRVFVIAIDSLEPVILSLKKVEEYEFAEKLSPDDRDNICRIIAKFAHTAKRKIQIDSFLNQRLAEVLIECNVLPEEFRDKVVKMETADKLNPPQDRRNKNNSQKEIEKDIKLIGNIAHLAEINVDPDIINDLNKIPLYK